MPHDLRNLLNQLGKKSGRTLTKRCAHSSA